MGRFTSARYSWFTYALLAIVSVTPSRAQAKYTASHPVSLQSFGTITYVFPKYTPIDESAGTDFGASAGVDLDISPNIWVHPGLDLRGTMALGGGVSNQYTFSVGPRVLAPFRRGIQPYADFLIGIGKIDFTQHLDPNYLSNQSAVYSYGGGFDYPLKHGWAVKVDAQVQRWRLTNRQPPFYPLVVSVGFRYLAHGNKHTPGEH